MRNPVTDLIKIILMHYIFKWIRGLKMAISNKVMFVSEQGRTLNNGFQLGKFRFIKYVCRKLITTRVLNACNRFRSHTVIANTIGIFKK